MRGRGRTRTHLAGPGPSSLAILIGAQSCRQTAHVFRPVAGSGLARLSDDMVGFGLWLDMMKQTRHTSRGSSMASRTCAGCRPGVDVYVREGFAEEGIRRQEVAPRSDRAEGLGAGGGGRLERFSPSQSYDLVALQRQRFRGTRAHVITYGG